MELLQPVNPAEMPVSTHPYDAGVGEFLQNQSAAEAVHAASRPKGDDLRRASDEALVSKAKAGDRQSFVELCNRHGRCVKLKILQIVRNRDDSEDVLQETLMRAYMHLNGFRGNCSFRTWFTQIAINNALMLLRRRRTRSEIGCEIVGEGGEIIDHWPIVDPTPNPEQLYLRSQTRQMLNAAVKGLPPNFLSIVEKFHMNELKLSDAAQALGLKDGAAKSRLLRARALLRRRLQNQISGEA